MIIHFSKKICDVNKEENNSENYYLCAVNSEVSDNVNRGQSRSPRIS